MENTKIKTHSMIDSRLDEIIKEQNELLKKLQDLTNLLVDKFATENK